MICTSLVKALHKDEARKISIIDDSSTIINFFNNGLSSLKRKLPSKSYPKVR